MVELLSYPPIGRENIAESTKTMDHGATYPILFPSMPPVSTAIFFFFALSTKFMFLSCELRMSEKSNATANLGRSPFHQESHIAYPVGAFARCICVINVMHLTVIDL